MHNDSVIVNSHTMDLNLASKLTLGNEDTPDGGTGIIADHTTMKTM